MKKQLLNIKNLHSSIEDKAILKGLNLEVNAGEIHVIMGPNGAGKSTLANVLMGHPAHEVVEGEVYLDQVDLLSMKVNERAKAGLFLSFQYPQEVPGVTVESFLRAAKKETSGIMPSVTLFNKEVQQAMATLQMDAVYKERYLNQGFSGGEKKKNEILQMSVLKPKVAILDETDSGLDIDAIRIVYETVQSLANEKNAVIIITHYNKILDYIQPDAVHILVDGKIVQSGDLALAKKVEQDGYDAFKTLSR